jgi:hypothetical protein
MDMVVLVRYAAVRRYVLVIVVLDLPDTDAYFPSTRSTPQLLLARPLVVRVGSSKIRDSRFVDDVVWFF